MGTPKPLHNDRQPAGNQPRSDLTVRIHRYRCAKETPLAHLPTPKTHKQRPHHRTDRVLKVGYQLDREQRKGPAVPWAQKARNGNSLLLEVRKQLNGIPPVRGNLSIAIKIATDRAERPNKGEKIDLTGQKRFFVFPNRLESVKVGKLNCSAALLTRGQVFALPRTFRPASL
jgi:hypothetical protein